MPFTEAKGSVSAAPAKVGRYGIPVIEDGPKFEGTDVCVANLFRYLDEGYNLPTFLLRFPDVSLEQTREAIKHDLQQRLKKIVRSRAGYVSGTPCFVGTRIPAKTLFDHLDRHNLPDELFEDFPGISRDQANETLALAREMIEWLAYEDFA